MENWTATVERNSTYGLNTTAWNFNNGKCEFVFDVVVLTVLCFVGFLGNSVTIAVLRRDRDPKRQRTTNWLLAMLAVVDSIYLACLFIVFPVRIIAGNYMSRRTSMATYVHLMRPLLLCSRTACMLSIWIVVLITIDRYLAICRPLDTKWRNLRRIKIAVAVLFILAVTYRIPEFLSVDGRIRRYCTDAGHIAHECREWLCYYYIYQLAIPFIFQYVGPFVTVLVLNVRICMAIKELNKRRSEMTKAATDESTMSVMVVVVVSVFVICQFPRMVLLFLKPTTVYFQASYNCYLVVTDALLALNSSMNFLLYCLLWGKFKRILVRMITCGAETVSSENQNRL